MSLVLLAGATTVGLWWASSHSPSPTGKPAEAAPRTIARRFMSTGMYGDVSEIGDILDKPEFIASVTYDVDLTGAPVKWIELTNGAVYKSYDTGKK